MFDTKTLGTIKTIAVQGDPDGILFEAATQRIYILSHKAPDVSVLDAKDGSIVGTIDLGGMPEQGQSDGAGRVYIDLADKNKVAVVDANTLKVTGTYDLAGKGGRPSGLGLDSKNHVLFAFCRKPQTCVILSATDGTILTTLPIGPGVDGGGFDPGTMEAFSSQADGTLTIIKENTPTSFQVRQIVKTMPGAKTCTLDRKTDRIFLVTAEYGAPAAQAAGGQGSSGPQGYRGPMLPNSFTILSVGK
jgi:DNA-binding beta-propeller fold protein YncE